MFGFFFGKKKSKPAEVAAPRAPELRDNHPEVVELAGRRAEQGSSPERSMQDQSVPRTASTVSTDPAAGNSQAADATGSVSEKATYEAMFIAACAFTKKQGFRPDAEVFQIRRDRVADEITSLTKLIPDSVGRLGGTGAEQIHDFGGNCGNVHLTVLEMMKESLRGVPVNLTIGHFEPALPNEFDFTEETFKSWLKVKPPVLDCHVWLTIGTNLIVDFTLATFINTRRLGSADLRGTLFGLPGMLELVGAPDVQGNLPKISYRPVAVGEQALRAIGPSPQ